MNVIKFMAKHHAGGIANDKYARSQHLTAENIDAAHRVRWNFVSSLGKYGGYNFFIEKNGKVTQFRAIGEETAAQIGFNFNAVSTCFAGNFVMENGVPIEAPTEEQKLADINLTHKIMTGDFSGIAVIPGTEIKLTPESIHHHSFFQNTTECDCLSDGYWRDNYKKYLATANTFVTSSTSKTFDLIDAIIALLLQLKEHLKVVLEPKRVGAVDRSCCGYF